MTVAEPVRNEGVPCGPCRVGNHAFAHGKFAHKLMSDQECSCDCRGVRSELRAPDGGFGGGRDA